MEQINNIEIVNSKSNQLAIPFAEAVIFFIKFCCISFLFYLFLTFCFYANIAQLYIPERFYGLLLFLPSVFLFVKGFKNVIQGKGLTVLMLCVLSLIVLPVLAGLAFFLPVLIGLSFYHHGL